MIDNGMVTEKLANKYRVINTKIVRKTEIYTLVLKTFSASLSVVCLTIPLYEPLSIKLSEAAAITIGICLRN